MGSRVNTQNIQEFASSATRQGHIRLVGVVCSAYFSATMQSNIITVIPVYNGEKFIRQTLESAAKQTMRADRVIVLDTCSNDGTEKIVKEFQPIRCEYIRNPKNLGLF